jgi:hypothetical protein
MRLLTHTKPDLPNGDPEQSVHNTAAQKMHRLNIIKDPYSRTLSTIRNHAENINGSIVWQRKHGNLRCIGPPLKEHGKTLKRKNIQSAISIYTVGYRILYIKGLVMVNFIACMCWLSTVTQYYFNHSMSIMTL